MLAAAEARWFTGEGDGRIGGRTSGDDVTPIGREEIETARTSGTFWMVYVTLIVGLCEA